MTVLSFSAHATQRMTERKITPRMIEEVLRLGVQTETRSQAGCDEVGVTYEYTFPAMRLTSRISVPANRVRAVVTPSGRVITVTH
jgi:Domain of unknown function (DUF4258)